MYIELGSKRSKSWVQGVLRKSIFSHFASWENNFPVCSQKWFLRPYFPLNWGMFNFRSGLRFSFRALEAAGGMEREGRNSGPKYGYLKQSAPSIDLFSTKIGSGCSDLVLVKNDQNSQNLAWCYSKRRFSAPGSPKWTFENLPHWFTLWYISDF